jgi:hypothetical protein
MTTLQNQLNSTIKNYHLLRKQRLEREKAQEELKKAGGEIGLAALPVFKNFILPPPPPDHAPNEPNEPTAPSAAPSTMNNLEIPPLPKAA